MNGCRNAWNVQHKVDDRDPRVAHIGLFHRKSNNDAMAVTQAARFFFDGKDGPVDISSEKTQVWATDENKLRRAILGFFDGTLYNEVSLQDVYTAFSDIKEDQVRSRLKDLVDQGFVIRLGRGKYQKAPDPKMSQDVPF